MNHEFVNSSIKESFHDENNIAILRTLQFDDVSNQSAQQINYWLFILYYISFLVFLNALFMRGTQLFSTTQIILLILGFVSYPMWVGPLEFFIGENGRRLLAKMKNQLV